MTVEWLQASLSENSSSCIRERLDWVAALLGDVQPPPPDAARFSKPLCARGSIQPRNARTNANLRPPSALGPRNALQPGSPRANANLRPLSANLRPRSARESGQLRGLMPWACPTVAIACYPTRKNRCCRPQASGEGRCDRRA